MQRRSTVRKNLDSRLIRQAHGVRHAWAVLLPMLLVNCAPATESEVSVWVDPAIFSTEARMARKQGRSPLQRTLTDSWATGGSRVLVGPWRGQLDWIPHSTLRTPLQTTADELTPSVGCVGLNIMGANISSALPQEGSQAWTDYKEEVLSGDSCSYPGKVSNAVSVETGGTITIQVPYGSDRVIQLVGYAGVDCTGTISGDDFQSESEIPGVYELGREVADLFDKSPEVAIDFELTVLDQIETNETAPDTETFVPDIRCQVKGEPAEQYVELQTKAMETCQSGTYWNGTSCVEVGLGFFATGDGVKQECSNAPTGGVYTDAQATSDDCAWTCEAGMYKSGSSCVDAEVGYYASGDGVRQECTNAPAQGFYIGTGMESADCSWDCGAGYYKASGACADVGVGFYSTGDGVRRSCTNAPTHTAYTNSNATSSTCAWSCLAGYHEESGACGTVGVGYFSTGNGIRQSCSNAPESAAYTSTTATSASCPWSCVAGTYLSEGACPAVGLGHYSTGDGVRQTCSNAPEGATYTDPNETSASCDFSCPSGSFLSDGACEVCEAGTYWTGSACDVVGLGYYSTGTGERFSCSNKPANSVYSSTIASSASCPWDCDTNYIENAGSCVYASGLNCPTGQVAVGVYGRAGAILDRLGIRCASMTEEGVGAPANGDFVGGMGGSAYTYDCPAGSILDRVQGTNAAPGYATSTASNIYQCRSLTTGLALTASGTYGGGNGSQSFNHTCGSEQAPYGINVGSDPSGSFSGFTLGVNCSDCPAGTYWNGSGCVYVGVGYYSDGDGVRQECENIDDIADPAATYYTDIANTGPQCAWNCAEGMIKKYSAATGYSCETLTAGTYERSCADGQVMTGIIGNQGWGMVTVGVRCADVTDGEVGTSSDTSVLGDAAATHTFGASACDLSTEAVFELQHTRLDYGTLGSIMGNIRPRCGDLTTGVLDSTFVTPLALWYDSTSAACSAAPLASGPMALGASQAGLGCVTHTCPSGHPAYGVILTLGGEYEAGKYNVGQVQELLCR